ncbi:MAG: ABC transporter permease, partial [Clostridia bacterium]|nr:ABC transporter permease [Clostridia bacterium]
MTTQKLSSEKLFDAKLLKNLTRRRLPHLLVAFIVNFFTICVPFLMWMGDYRDRYLRGTDIYARYVLRSANAVQETMVINLVFMFILGIYFGIITLGYMMKRRSAHFYHALPESRETLYTTSVTSALICAVLGGIAAIVIGFIQIAVNSLAVWEVLQPFFILLFKNVVMFLAAYSITVFAGSFSGNGLVQALMSLVIMFYPLAVYAGFVAYRAVHSNYFWSDYYFSEEVIEWLSPVTYISFNYLGPVHVLPTVIALLVFAALIMGGLVIYKKRAIENSERPIVFKKLGEALKYVLMFAITMFAGLFFQAVGYSDFHMVFGILCGAVLSWMLFNTILAKSPKAMFKGVKGLVLFLVVFALFSAVVCYDITNYDEYVPSENNIRHARIEVGGIDYSNDDFDDPEMLAALSHVLKNQLKENKKGYVAPLSGNEFAFSIDTVMYTKLGLPVARTYRISKYVDGATEFLKLFADDERMNDEHQKVNAALLDLVADGYSADIHVNCNNYRGDLENPDLKTFIETYIRELGKVDYERVSKPIVATVDINNIRDAERIHYNLNEVYGINWNWSELTIYADMTDTIRILGVKPVYAAPTVLRNDKDYELPIHHAMLYDTRENCYEDFDTAGYSSALSMYPCKDIPGETATALANAVAWINESGYSNMRIFTEIDTDCILHIAYGDYPEDVNSSPEDYYVYDEYGIKGIEIDYYEQTKYAGESAVAYVGEDLGEAFA